MEQNRSSWGPVITSAALTALFSLIVGLVLFNWTQNKPLLVFEVLPTVNFTSATQNLTIWSGSITNNGDKLAEDVVALISLPTGLIVKDYQIKASPSTISFQTTKPDPSTLKVLLPNGLNPNSNLSFSLLSEGASNETIQFAASGKGVNATNKDSSDGTEKKSILSILNRYFMLIIFISYLIILFLMIDYVIPKYLIYFANKYLQSERYGKARLYFKIAILLSERDVRAHSYLAITLSRMGRADESVIENLLALSLAPNDWVVLRNAAAISAKDGKFEESFSHMEKSIEVYDGESKHLINAFDNWREFKEIKNTKTYESFKSSLNDLEEVMPNKANAADAKSRAAD